MVSATAAKADQVTSAAAMDRSAARMDSATDHRSKRSAPAATIPPTTSGFSESRIEASAARTATASTTGMSGRPRSVKTSSLGVTIRGGRTRNPKPVASSSRAIKNWRPARPPGMTTSSRDRSISPSSSGVRSSSRRAATRSGSLVPSGIGGSGSVIGRLSRSEVR